jgi:SAM-dependent methyltransferase
METLADRSYWDQVWANAAVPSVAPERDPHQAALDGLFRRLLDVPAGGARFIEIGAGASAWPAHVARASGAEAWGIDLSPAGLAVTAEAAARAGVPVRLIEGDFFDEAMLPARAFDVVYSGGFVEHFLDPAPVMRRLAQLVSERGVVVTTVPNLRGVNGALQRWADPECYARHVVFTPDGLDHAHALGGLYPIEPARYLGALDLASVNLSRRLSPLPRPVRAIVWRTLGGTRRLAHAAMTGLRADSGGATFAPAILGTYALSSSGRV